MLMVGTLLVVVGAGSGYALISGRHAAGDGECITARQVERLSPALRLEDLYGTTVDLESLRGQVVLLNLWATWCPPCREEMPELERFHQAHREAGLVVVGINIGEAPGVVAQFAATTGLTFPIWLDPDEASLRALQMLSLPATIAIDRSGMIRLVWAGPVCFDQLEEQAAPLLSE